MILSDAEKKKLVSLATQLLGKAYRLGAETISDDLRMVKRLSEITEIDCSELVEWCFWVALRIKLPDGSWNQYAVCDISDLVDAAQEGDLVFRRRVDTKAICHIGIYIGGGMVIEAFGQPQGVITRSIQSFMKPSSRSEFAGIGRINLSKVG